MIFNIILFYKPFYGFEKKKLSSQKNARIFISGRTGFVQVYSVYFYMYLLGPIL